MFNVALVRCKIGDVNHCFGRCHATEEGLRTGDDIGERLRVSAKAGGVLCGRNEAEGLAIPAIDISKLGVADAHCILQHGRQTPAADRRES